MTAAPALRRQHRVVLISPARDEEATLERTIECVAAQTVRPRVWVIVDDGSTDGTQRVLEKATREHPWIRVVQRPDRGFRAVGGGVIDAFYAGLASIDEDYDFVGKLDVDVTFAPDYLERILGYFDADSGLAAASGKVFHEDRGRLVEEFSMVEEMVAGCFKLYRRDAFERIGGFVREVMWDGIDFHRARLFGYRTRSLPDPALRIVHLRLMGSSDRNVLRGRLRWGRGQWFMGSSFLYVLASGARRLLEKPRGIGGLLIVAGYLQAALARSPRYADPAFRRELRRWQRARLLSTLGLRPR